MVGGASVDGDGVVARRAKRADGRHETKDRVGGRGLSSTL
jgi:hypothetical protein